SLRVLLGESEVHLEQVISLEQSFVVRVIPPKVGLNVCENGPSNQRVIHVSRLLGRNTGKPQISLSSAEQIIQFGVERVGFDPHDLLEVIQEHAGGPIRHCHLVCRQKRRRHVDHSSAGGSGSPFCSSFFLRLRFGSGGAPTSMYPAPASPCSRSGHFDLSSSPGQ